jgi:hypothetical protein
MNATGVPHRVTSVTEGQHAPGSYHYRTGTNGIGLAVDFAGPVPSRDSPELLAIFRAFQPVEHLLHELIYGGADYAIKAGARVKPYAVSDHMNHVHVSVDRSVFIPVPQPKVPPMFDPPLPGFCAWLSHPTRGGWGLAPDGGVFALDAPFYGSAAGQSYFVGRRAARLEARADGGYDIVAISGERYGYPAH